MEPSKSQRQARSNGLPSKQHPIFQQCYDHLQRFVPISETINSSSSSSLSSMISHKLHCLEDLHECVEKLLNLPLTQQAFVQAREEKWIDPVLDGSLKVLDSCTAAKDSVLHAKESAREVQSIIRRRGTELRVESEMVKYLASRQVVKKAIKKALKNLHSVQTKGVLSSFLASNNDSDIATALVDVLREVELVTLGVLETLMCFVCGTKAKSHKWSLVSKISRSKRVSCEGERKVANEFENVDDIVHSLLFCESRKCRGTLDVENVKTQLRNLESCVLEFEVRLEGLFRRLIRTRVSLLNILNK